MKAENLRNVSKDLGAINNVNNRKKSPIMG